VVIDGTPARENAPVAICNQEAFQNGDLDYDGTGYHADWPDGSTNFSTSISYTGPFTRGQPYPDIQFETDAASSESLCDVATGAGCTAPPLGAAFYPFWSLTNHSASRSCVWNFGNDIANVTTNDFGKDAQYGVPDVARYGGDPHQPGNGQPLADRELRRSLEPQASGKHYPAGALAPGAGTLRARPLRPGA
jgi:hypothetical protein